MARWNIFRRRNHDGHPPAPPAPPASSETWAIGDQAECLASPPWTNIFGQVASGPQRGEVRIVDALCHNGCHLGFARWPGRLYEARVFRKVTPRADALTRAEPAFLELIAPSRVLTETLAIAAMVGTGFSALWIVTPS